MSDPDTYAIEGLLLRLGRLSLEAGVDTSHAHRLVSRAAAALKVDTQLFIGSERLLLMTNRFESGDTRIGHAIAGFGINAARSVKLEHVVDALAVGMLNFDQAVARLEEIERDHGLYPAWVIVVAVAATAAALARLFGALWPVVVGAFVAGLASALVKRWFVSSSLNPVTTALFTAFISGVAGVAVLRLFADSAAALTLTAAGMILVPGVPLINGISDLVQGHPTMGVARLANALVTILAIASGLLLASQATGAVFPVLQAPGNVGVAEDLLFSAIAAFGYVTLFNVPAPAIWLCIACGMITHGSRTAMSICGMNIASATLISAVLGGLIACLFARKSGLPWTVFAFPGVVAMIPGSYAFRSAIGFSHILTMGAATPLTLVAETLSASVAVAFMTTAVGIGLFAAFSIARAIPWFRLKC